MDPHRNFQSRGRESFALFLADGTRAPELHGVACNSETRVVMRITPVFRRKTPTFQMRLSGSSVNPKWPNFETDFKLPSRYVRRVKVRMVPWVRDPPGNSVVPAGSSRSGDGGNEIVKAFGEEGSHRRLSELAGRNASEHRAGPENGSGRSRPSIP